MELSWLLARPYDVKVFRLSFLFLCVCLCSAAPLRSSRCVCLFFAWRRVLCFFNLIPICELHLHINPIGGVVRGPLVLLSRYCSPRDTAAGGRSPGSRGFFVAGSVLPADDKVRFPDPNLRPSRFPTVFLLFPGSLPEKGGRAIGGAVAVWNLAGC